MSASALFKRSAGEYVCQIAMSNEAVSMVQSIPQLDSCKCTVNAYLVPLQPNTVVVDLNGRVADIAY